MLATIEACNIRNYSIFLHESLLIAYFEYHGDDSRCGYEDGRGSGDPALVVDHGPDAGAGSPCFKEGRWLEIPEVFHFDGMPVKSV